MIHRSPEAAQECGRYILKLLDQKPRSTLAISGGHSPWPMFRMFATCGFDWSRVELFWVDERGVPPTDNASNFKMTQEHLLQAVHIPLRQVHRIMGEILPWHHN